MNVTIDDESGTFIDTLMNSLNPTYNYGTSIIVWTHLATAGNKANFLTKTDTSSYSGITILNAHLGLTERGRNVTGYNIILNRVIAGDWIEGVHDQSTATTGEPSWDERAFGEVDGEWNVGGCNGSGTDFQAIAESTTFVGSAGLHTFDISIVTMQDIIDNPATNFGYVFRTIDASAGEYEQFHSSLGGGGAGTRPFLYMEYTETIGWNSNSYYGNRSIASINAPQRSRRIR